MSDNTSKHLWEVNHAYYCNEGNYFARPGQVGHHFDNFQDFMAEWGDADFDYNLLFRWDWSENSADEDGEVIQVPVYSGYDTVKTGKLKIFWMLQRKGKYDYCIIDVCHNDEPEVIEFLKPRLEYLKSLWEPLL